MNSGTVDVATKVIGNRVRCFAPRAFPLGATVEVFGSLEEKSKGHFTVLQRPEKPTDFHQDLYAGMSIEWIKKGDLLVAIS